MQILMSVMVVLFVAFYALSNKSTQNTPENHAPSQNVAKSETKSHQQTTKQGDVAIQQAFLNRQSDVQIRGVGTVKTILPDDNQGSRHQKFILNLENGHSILVSHNIDLAPRIQGLKKGDTVEFYGEYEYNPKGGVIHWTHHDPRKKHIDGYLKHQGQIYQ